MAYTFLDFTNFRASVIMFADTGQCDRNAPPLLKVEAMLREVLDVKPDDLLERPLAIILPPEMDEAMAELQGYVRDAEETAAHFDRVRNLLGKNLSVSGP